jgi:hypothetical protein
VPAMDGRERISPHGRISLIEMHYEQCLTKGDFRMIVQIQESGLKLT